MSSSPERTILGVAVGHAAHDTWFGVAPILLATLSVPMGIANSEIGFILMLYETLSALGQPFFGRLSERIGGRPLAVASILWTTSLFSLALFVESKLLLTVCLFAAGLGSAAWHPQGAANATNAGGKRLGATAASIFFLGGTLGSAFLGQALGGYLLSAYGRRSLLILALIAVVLALTLVRRWVPRWLLAGVRAPTPIQEANGTATFLFWVLLGFLLLSTALRSLAFHSINAYIPKYQQDLGVSSASYGALMSLFFTASAIGGVAGSFLADKVGIRSILIFSMGLAAIFFFLFMHTIGFWHYSSLALAGLFMGPSHTLLIVVGQRRFASRMAVVSGVFMGFTFISGAAGTWVLGLLADRVGLGTILNFLPWAMVGAVASAWVGVPGPSAKGAKSAG